MKLYFCSSLILALCAAFPAQAKLAPRLERISETLYQVEDQLRPQAYEEIRYLTERIEAVLRTQPDLDSPRMICVSNGETGVWEKWTPYNTGSQQSYGSATAKDRCQRIIQTVTNNLICTSNGESGVWERFTVFDLKLGINIGNQTSFESCLHVVSRSTRQFVCVSNGETGTWEKFSLFDRKSNSAIGGQTALQNCLASY